MHPAAEDSPLGKSSEYIATYTPSLLFPIPRVAKWAELGLNAETLPYQGIDFWNCFELSWLLPSGKPVVAMGEFAIPAVRPIAPAGGDHAPACAASARHPRGG